MELKTIKSKCEFNLNLAIESLLKDGWEIARNHYEKIIKDQRYYYIDMVKYKGKELKSE